MILLTGATGYIGSHTWVELLRAGYKVVGLDNFSNSSPKVLERIELITSQRVSFIECDICDTENLEKVFADYPIKAVIHFAALKSVADSIKYPNYYYKNNLGGLISLIEVMNKNYCKKIVFSSSATIYDSAVMPPYAEDAILRPINPYAWTKYVGENILRDMENSSEGWRVAYLRYFNPVGAHESGLIGEHPKGLPSNLMPYISQVAVGKIDSLFVYGGDWPTYDGTGIRDYVHVVDLAHGHIRALDYLKLQEKSLTVNLGSGKGYSVMEVISEFQEVADIKINYEIVGRREGDSAISYANPSLAKILLGWSAVRNINQMCKDAWRWQSLNPNGYDSIINHSNILK